MGVPWGVKYGSTEYDSVDSYLKRWKAFCASALCRHFVFPIDDMLYEFRLEYDGEVTVTSREGHQVIADMKALSCGDGTYEMFGMITDGIDLYVPDVFGVRRIDRPEFRWNYQRADSLNVLRWKNLRRLKSEILSDKERSFKVETVRLARELRTAANFCKKHRMMLGISY